MYARGAKFSDMSCLWVIGNVKNRVFAVVICTFLSIVICLANLMFDARSFFRPFKLKYKMYFSLVPLSLNCWFSLFCFCVSCFSIFIFKWNTSAKFIGKRQSKWERAFLYWYLQYFVTLWTEPQLDSQRFLCLPLIFLCYYYVSARFRIVDFPFFLIFTYSFLNETRVKFIGKRQWKWKRPFCIGICSLFWRHEPSRILIVSIFFCVLLTFLCYHVLSAISF